MKLITITAIILLIISFLTTWYGIPEGDCCYEVRDGEMVKTNAE